MANFNKAIAIILKNEGGYQKHPADKGNYNSRGILVGTNHGISAKTLEKWRAYPVTADDMMHLSLTEAKEIYHTHYWLPIHGNAIRDQDNAELIFDHAVNAGVGGSSKLVQKTLNQMGGHLSVDGSIGDKTMYELNRVNQPAFFDAFKQARIHFYQSVSKGSNATFLNGWIKRVTDFEKKK